MNQSIEKQRWNSNELPNKNSNILPLKICFSSLLARACTKTRNNETKQAKRNHRNERNETTETNPKPLKQAKRNHRNNERNVQNENQIRQIRYETTKTTSPRAIERQNYLTFRTLSSKAVL